MRRKQKTVCTNLSYIEHFLILAFAITECISISAFASFLGIHIGTTGSATGLKTCVITAGVKKYKSIIKKNKIKHVKTVLSAISKLNSIEVLISKALINSNISHDEFILINNVIKDYDETKEEIKNLKTQTVYQRF